MDAVARGSVGPDTTGIGPVLRSFGRVLLREEKAKTQAGVSVGDLNRDSLPDIVPGNGRHWSLYNRVLLNEWRSIGPIRRRSPRVRNGRSETSKGVTRKKNCVHS